MEGQSVAPCESVNVQLSRLSLSLSLSLGGVHNIFLSCKEASIVKLELRCQALAAAMAITNETVRAS
jgi:hypothetical protein